jgi:dTDP-4-dehydrorhamnose 3,5-epimerase
MIFKETKLPGAFLIEIDPLHDQRGFFARTWCSLEFSERGLNPNLVQCSISYNYKKGTLRGMHFQNPPYEETKLVRCTRGRIFDVIVDLRSASSTYEQWFGVELSAEDRNMLYVPEGFAHGFQTLEDCTEVSYQISQFYHSDHARGFKYDDASFGIQWPLPVASISEKDSCYPDYAELRKINIIELL